MRVCSVMGKLKERRKDGYSLLWCVPAYTTRTHDGILLFQKWLNICMWEAVNEFFVLLFFTCTAFALSIKLYLSQVMDFLFRFSPPSCYGGMSNHSMVLNSLLGITLSRTLLIYSVTGTAHSKTTNRKNHHMKWFASFVDWTTMLESLL